VATTFSKRNSHLKQEIYNPAISIDNHTDSGHSESNKSSKSVFLEPKVHTGVCFVKINNHFYDLNPLSSGCRYE